MITVKYQRYKDFVMERLVELNNDFKVNQVHYTFRRAKNNPKLKSHQGLFLQHNSIWKYLELGEVTQ